MNTMKIKKKLLTKFRPGDSLAVYNVTEPEKPNMYVRLPDNLGQAVYAKICYVQTLNQPPPQQIQLADSGTVVDKFGFVLLEFPINIIAQQIESSYKAGQENLFELSLFSASAKAAINANASKKFDDEFSITLTPEIIKELERYCDNECGSLHGMGKVLYLGYQNSLFNYVYPSLDLLTMLHKLRTGLGIELQPSNHFIADKLENIKQTSLYFERASNFPRC